MKTVWLAVIVCTFGCSHIERPTSAHTPVVQDRPSVTFDGLVPVNASLADMQHPLVCGVGRDIPDGHELTFRNPETRESVHAVFPHGVTPPKSLDGKFTLHGHFQTIQKRNSYTLKQPLEDYRYYLVTSWKQKE